jgi:AcrR family transcriptional regulator
VKYEPSDILEAAVRLINRDGVGVSMAKVADEAGVSNGTLFHYFGTKQDLLDQLYEWLKSDLIAAIGDVPDDLTATEQLRTLWMRWIGWVRRYPARHRVTQLLHGAGIVSTVAVEHGEAMFARYFAILADAQAAGSLADLPLAYLGESLMAQLEVAARSDLTEEQCSQAFDLAWSSIRPIAVR